MILNVADIRYMLKLDIFASKAQEIALMNYTFDILRQF